MYHRVFTLTLFQLQISQSLILQDLQTLEAKTFKDFSSKLKSVFECYDQNQ